MDINKYLSDHLIYKKDFCKILNISRSYFSEICTGKSNPSFKLILAIEKATDGKVNAKDWKKKKEEQK